MKTHTKNTEENTEENTRENTQENTHTKAGEWQTSTLSSCNAMPGMCSRCSRARRTRSADQHCHHTQAVSKMHPSLAAAGMHRDRLLWIYEAVRVDDAAGAARPALGAAVHHENEDDQPEAQEDKPLQPCHHKQPAQTRLSTRDCVCPWTDTSGTRSCGRRRGGCRRARRAAAGRRSPPTRAGSCEALSQLPQLHRGLRSRSIWRADEERSGRSRDRVWSFPHFPRRPRSREHFLSMPLGSYTFLLTD